MYKFMLLHANFLQELRKYVLWNCTQGHLAPWFSTWNTLQYTNKNSKIFKYLKIFRYIKNYDSFNFFPPLKYDIESRFKSKRFFFFFVMIGNKILKNRNSCGLWKFLSIDASKLYPIWQNIDIFYTNNLKNSINNENILFCVFHLWK